MLSHLAVVTLFCIALYTKKKTTFFSVLTITTFPS